MRNIFWTLVILIGIFFPVPVLGDEGIPFSGNHTVDLLSTLTREIPDDLPPITGEALVNLSSLGPATALFMGKGSLKSGDARGAEDYFSHVLKSDSQSGEAWKGLFVSLALQEKFDELLNRSSDRINLSPLDEEAWLNKGWALFSLHHQNAAASAFKTARDIDPKNPAAYYYAAWAYDEMGQKQNAIKANEKVILISPGFSGAWGNIGFLLQDLGQYQESLGYFDKALEVNPNWSEVRRSRGTSLYRLNDTEGAMKTWDEGIARDPGYIPTYETKARALMDQGRYEDALATLDKGLAREPDSSYLLRARGECLLKLERFAEALDMFEKGTTVKDFNYEYSLWGKGFSLDNLGRHDEAGMAYSQGLSRMNRILEKHTKWSSGWHTKGLLLEGLGNRTEAERAFKIAGELGYTDTTLI